MKYHIINKDNIIALKDYPDNYFDSVVTDPPYGLGKEPDAVELMKDWVEKGYYEIKGTGFMGKEWDAFVPQPLFWQEVFRVLKPGGHCLAFYGTRTYDWGVMAMRFAGFEVRDCIQWLYGSGFPKSHNIGKAIDKLQGNEREVVGEKKSGVSSRAYQSEEQTTAGVHYDTKGNSEWDGWGSALKPANEPIVLARKPLEKGLSIAENVLKWGTGGINIDGCRIGTRTENESGWSKSGSKASENRSMSGSNYDRTPKDEIGLGRWPANIILTHHPECECNGLKKVKAIKGGCKFQSAFFKSGESNFTKDGGLGDENGQETVEDWNCHPDCPIKILDEQSGNGASRFFYVAKASKSERNKGLEGFEEKNMPYGSGGGAMPSGNENTVKTKNKNFHPTVKPVKLMQYLIRLVTPPNGKVLDPFCGSGTTGIACKLEGFEFVGIEQDTEYCKIAEARIKNTKQDINLFNCV